MASGPDRARGNEFAGRPLVRCNLDRHPHLIRIRRRYWRGKPSERPHAKDAKVPSQVLGIAGPQISE